MTTGVRRCWWASTVRARSAKLIRSGPPMFTTPPAGSATARAATSAATSAAAIGWMDPSGTRTSAPTMSDSTMASANSSNWVARTMV